MPPPVRANAGFSHHEIDLAIEQALKRSSEPCVPMLSCLVRRSRATTWPLRVQVDRGYALAFIAGAREAFRAALRRRRGHGPHCRGR